MQSFNGEGMHSKRRLVAHKSKKSEFSSLVRVIRMRLPSRLETNEGRKKEPTVPSTARNFYIVCSTLIIKLLH